MIRKRRHSASPTFANRSIPAKGANIELIRNGRAVDKDDGPYGAEGYVRQAIAELPQFDGNYTVLGSWFAAGAPCGLSVREDLSPITKNNSRFLPHAIVE
jgi:glutathionylspermidine synthase